MGNSRLFRLRFRFEGLIALVLICTACFGCAALGRKLIKPPRVELESVSLKDFASSGVTIVFGVAVENPNPFEIKVDSLRYEVDLDGRRLTEAELFELPSVGAKGTEIVSVPVPVRYSDMVSSVLSFLSKNKSHYRVRGEARVGVMKIPFDRSGELNLKSDK